LGCDSEDVEAPVFIRRIPSQAHKYNQVEGEGYTSGGVPNGSTFLSLPRAKSTFSSLCGMDVCTCEHYSHLLGIMNVDYAMVVAHWHGIRLAWVK
jgi:hypothetical protein